MVRGWLGISCFLSHNLKVNFPDTKKRGQKRGEVKEGATRQKLCARTGDYTY
jgi:hypothetical protein